MYELKKLNVHRIAQTDEQRDKLIKQGFEIVETPKEKPKGGQK